MIFEEIEYSSEFNSEYDSIDIDGNFDWEQFQPTEVLMEELEDCASNWAESKGFDFQTLLDEDILRGKVNAIVSVTGDDEIITSNSCALNFVHFASAYTVNRIKVSEKDTGISYMLGNYTEGWVILPPNAEADHASVTRRHIKSGVATVFDITKLKATSAVRKQSSKEFDFESKFGQLYKSAGWTDQDWFTYDYAQMSLVLASAIFDYNECRIFPYLFPQEGGCGGFPPWKNIDTSVSALSFFNGKKSMSSILAIMDEAAQIQSGNLAPEHGIYISASHYAQTGDPGLSRIYAAKNFLSMFSLEDRVRCLENCKGMMPLPVELIENSVLISPKDKLIGSAIAEMRKNGLVMTELDVRLKGLGEHKFFSLLKNENMGAVKKKTDEEKMKIKKNAFSELAKLAQGDKKVFQLSDNKNSIMNSYYKMRSDFSDITGYSYEGQIRVFKTKDVQDYYEKSSLGLADDIIASLESYKDFRIAQKLGQAKTDLEYQIKWMESGRLQDLFEGEIPPSMGSDDARIGRKILRMIEDLKDEVMDLAVFIVITNDKSLVTDLRLLSKGKNVEILRLGVNDYIKDAYRNVKTGYVKAMNCFTNEMGNFPSIDSLIKGVINWRASRSLYHVLWDFPNINRALEGLRKTNRGLFRIEGGFLRRATSRNLEGWSSMEWSRFKVLKDFDRTLNKMY